MTFVNVKAMSRIGPGKHFVLRKQTPEVPWLEAALGSVHDSNDEPWCELPTTLIAGDLFLIRVTQPYINI